MKKRTGNWCELAFFRVNAIASCGCNGCNPFCRLVVHFVAKSRANYIWEIVAEQEGPPISNYFLQRTPSEIVHFIQIYIQKTRKQTFLISCNTYNEKGTASITKGMSSLSQTDPTSQKVERSIGIALIKHRNISGVTRINQKSNIHKIMCNSASVLRLVNVQIWKTSMPSVLLPTISHIFMSWKGEGQGECLHDRRFAKAVELIWDISSQIPVPLFRKVVKTVPELTLSETQEQITAHAHFHI